jgi:hypothetical protein
MRDGVKQSGPVSLWDMKGDSGKGKTRAFCPKCGSPVFMTYPENAGVFTIHAGSLDEPGRFKPQAVTYTMRALAWDKLDPALHRFDKMPPM